MSSAILSFRSTTKIYRHGLVEVPAVRGVDLDLAAGTITAVMGPSGSGKSTLLHLAAGMVIPSSGQVLVDGDDVGRRSPADLARLRRTDVGVVFQQYNLLPTLTALENVRLALDVRGLKGKSGTEHATEALKAVGLAHRLNSYPRNMSGGEQQRVAVARALAGSPSLILADEPTAALDAENGKAVMALLAELARDKSRAILAVTHDGRTLPFADRIVNIEDGVIVGERRQKHDRPKSTGHGHQAVRVNAKPHAKQKA